MTDKLRFATWPSSWACSWCALAIAIACCPAEASAQASPPPRIDIAAQDLPAAIGELAREAQVSIGTEGALPQIRVRRLSGRMSVAAALARMLRGTGYRAEQVGPTAWRIVRAPAPSSTPVPARPARTVAASVPVVVSEPIIVRASKRDTSLANAPFAVAALPLANGDTRLPADGTGWVAANVDGFAMTGTGPGRNKLFLRGVADSAFSGEAQATVAVMVNDARVTYAAPDPDLRLVDVQQVEVLKGPQGSLYGTGTLGGIYRISTVKPDLDRASLSLQAGGALVGGGSGGANGAAIANLPLIPGKAAVRLVGYGERAPGWVDTGALRNTNSTGLVGGRASFAAEAPGGWRFDLLAMTQRLETKDSSYVYRAGARSRPAQLPEPHDNDFDLLSLRIERPLGSARLVLASSLTWHEVRDIYDATHGAESFGLAQPATVSDERKYKVWDSEIRVSGGPVGREWLVGIAHVESREQALIGLSSSLPLPVLVVDDDHRTASDSAIFGNYLREIAPHFAVELGARLFRSSVSERRILGSATIRAEEVRTGVEPSAALRWTPREGRMLYARYGTAYRAGGIDIGSDGSLENYSSDALETFEAGWRESLSGGGRIELGAYYTNWRDLQSDMLLPDGLIETRNAGQARIIGAEASLQMPLMPAWDLTLGGTLQDAQLVRNQLDIKLEDTRLPVVPEYVVRAGLTRRFTLGSVSGSLALMLRYLGPARLSFDPALDRPMGNVLENRVELRLKAGGFDIALVADNPLGNADDRFAFGNPFRIATSRQYTPQQPFTVALSVGRKF